MQALFYILVAVAIAVGIWQFTKVLNLNRTVANTKDNNIQGKLMLGFLVVFYLWMFFTVLKWKHVFLPDAATEEGYHYDQLWAITMAVIVFVQIVTQFLLFFFLRFLFFTSQTPKRLCAPLLASHTKDPLHLDNFHAIKF